MDNSVVTDRAILGPGGPETFVNIREGKNIFGNTLLLKCCLSECNSSLGFWFHFYLGILCILLIFKSLSHNPLDFCVNLQAIFMSSFALATWCLQE